MRATGRTFILIAVVATLKASAQCTTALYPPSTTDQIGIWRGTGWSSDAPIESGINLWLIGCPDYATDFPAFMFNQTAAINITVNYNTGQNPVSGAGCGIFNHSLGPTSGQVVGGSVEVYERDSLGNWCTWPGWAAKIIAHELGHVLGLANTTCTGKLMSVDYPTVSGPASDECEMADNRWRVSDEEADGGPIVPSYDCPLVLDLNGDGIHTTGLDQPVYFFDRTGDGVGDRTGWLDASSADAFLWIDLDDDRRVQAGELFGSHMYVPTGVYVGNGFQALEFYDAAAFGGNGDGVISRDDEVWRSLRLWHDRNHDGQSSPNEISRLARHGIVELGLGRSHVHIADEHGNAVMLQGSYTRRVPRHRTVERRMDDILFVRSY